jgi:hypothetical protein
MAKHWIQEMHMKEGAFTAKAKAAGKGTQEYAREKKSASGKTGKQARLDLILKGLRSAKG